MTHHTDVLRNPKYELYAQFRAKGLEVTDAAKESGFSRQYAYTHLERRPEIVRRIKQLLQNSAKRVELSRRDILDRIFEDWELSRKLGQMSAALKSAELMGREMHRMFVERKEIGAPGDFDNKSEDELREIILKEMKELGWDEQEPPPSSSIN